MHLARLLAAQMTTAGIGKGAKSKGIKPQVKGAIYKVEFFATYFWFYAPVTPSWKVLRS